MSDEPDVFAELQQALDVRPSPEFAAHVRQRTATAPRRAWTIWAWIVLGTAAPAAVVALISLRGPVRPVVPAPPVMASEPARPVPMPQVVDRTPAPARVSPVVETRRAEPEVLVPDDERIALNRLLAAVRQGRSFAPAPASRVSDDADGRMAEPAPLDVPVMKVELLPGTPADRSGGRFPWF